MVFDKISLEILEVKNIMLIISLFISSTSMSSNTYGHGRAVDEIESSIKLGSVKGIVKYIENAVDISIINSISTCGKPQAELVLTDFFKKHSVLGFDIDHSGASTFSDAFFVLGKLKTEKGLFKVYIFMKESNNLYTLKEIRFEKMNI